MEEAANLLLNPSSGDCTSLRDVRESLILAHRPLVLSIAAKARRAHRDCVELEDLVSAGFEGLCEAVQRFDPKRGVHFSSYARWWILNKINGLVRQQRWPLHIPEQVYRQIPSFLTEVNEFVRDKRQSTGVSPTADIIAAHLHMSMGEYYGLLRWLDQDFVSLSAALSEDGHISWEDILPGKLPSPDSGVIGTSSTITRMLRELSETESNVITMRFGLTGDVPLTLQQIASKLASSPAHIRSIEHAALTALWRIASLHRRTADLDIPEDASVFVRQLRGKLDEAREHINHPAILNSDPTGVDTVKEWHQ